MRIWSRRPGEATGCDAKVHSRLETGCDFIDSNSLRQCSAGKDQGRISHGLFLYGPCRCDVEVEQQLSLEKDKASPTVRLGLVPVWMETRDPPDKQVEISRPALDFLLANRNCSTNSDQYEVWLQLLRGVFSKWGEIT